VRVFHAAPNAPPLDLYAGPSTSRGELVSNNIPYGSATSFQSVGLGSQALELTRAGAPYDQLYAVPLELKKGDQVDLVVAEEATGTLHVVVLHENSTPPDAGTVRLRVLNASLDATPAGVDLGSDGSIDLPDLALFHDSGEKGVEIPSVQRQPLAIVVGGATVGSFTLPGLPVGGDTLLVLTGYAAKSPRDPLGLSLLAPGLGLVKQDSSAYFANLVPVSKSSLDIYVSNVLVASDLQIGDMVPIPSTDGRFGAKACPHGERLTSACIPIGTVAYPFSAQPGHNYLVLVHFKVEDFLSTFFDDSFDVDQGNPQLRFINSEAIGSLDVGLVDGGQFTIFDDYSPIGYLDGAVSSGPVLPPGTYTLGFRRSGDAFVYSFETVLRRGSRSFAIFGPPPDGASGSHLYMIDTATRPWSRTVLSPLP